MNSASLKPLYDKLKPVKPDSDLILFEWSIARNKNSSVIPLDKLLSMLKYIKVNKKELEYNNEMMRISMVLLKIHKIKASSII